MNMMQLLVTFTGPTNAPNGRSWSPEFPCSVLFENATALFGTDDRNCFWISVSNRPPPSPEPHHLSGTSDDLHSAILLEKRPQLCFESTISSKPAFASPFETRTLSCPSSWEQKHSRVLI
jgi:hypothetical protein